MINWDEYKSDEGSINLVEVYKATYGEHNVTNSVIKFLTGVEKIQPISSRQVAALAIQTAYRLHIGG